MLIQIWLVHVRDRPHLFAHDSGGVVHGRGRGKAIALVEVAAQEREDRLRTREVPAGQEDEDALPRIDDRVLLLDPYAKTLPATSADWGIAKASDAHLLGDVDSVIDLDAEVANRASIFEAKAGSL